MPSQWLEGEESQGDVQSVERSQFSGNGQIGLFNLPKRVQVSHELTWRMGYRIDNPDEPIVVNKCQRLVERIGTVLLRKRVGRKANKSLAYWLRHQ